MWRKVTALPRPPHRGQNGIDEFATAIATVMVIGMREGGMPSEEGDVIFSVLSRDGGHLSSGGP